MANKNLKAAGNAALNKFFTQGAESEEAKGKTEKATKKTTKPRKEVFSFRAELGNLIEFRAYCAARCGMTPDDVATAAMHEYIQNHPLAQVEKDVFKKKCEELKTHYDELEQERRNK